MAVPTNNSEQYLFNKTTAARLAYILDALLGAFGKPGYGTGMTSAMAISAANTTAISLSPAATPGVLNGFDAGNTNAAWRYVKLYDKATAPTQADTPIRRFALPPGGGISKSGISIQFASQLWVRITTGQADNDNTAPGAGDVEVNVDFSV